MVQVSGVALRWLGDPDDPTGTFEDIGAWYQAETGPSTWCPVDSDSETKKADRLPDRPNS